MKSPLPATKSSPRSPQLEKARVQQWRPRAPKVINKLLKRLTKNKWNTCLGTQAKFLNIKDKTTFVHDLKLLFIYLFFISWRLIALQYCSGFWHTLTWISHGFTCIPHSDPPSHLPLYPVLLGFPSAPGPSTCLMHPTWAGDLFHPRYYTCFNADLSKHPTLAFSHRVLFFIFLNWSF